MHPKKANHESLAAFGVQVKPVPPYWHELEQTTVNSGDPPPHNDTNDLLYNFGARSLPQNRNQYMNLRTLALSAAVSAALLFAVPVLAAEDPARFLLSPALLHKLKAAEADMQALHQPGETEAPDDDKDTSIEGAIRKIDKDTNTTTVLARHSLSSRELVLSAHALLHAGMYLAAELEDQRKAAQSYKGYTTQQKANIAIVRAFATPRKP